jgi:hypothetical protein
MVSQVHTITNNSQKIVGPAKGFSSYNPLFKLIYIKLVEAFLHVVFIKLISQIGYG